MCNDISQKPRVCDGIREVLEKKNEMHGKFIDLGFFMPLVSDYSDFLFSYIHKKPRHPSHTKKLKIAV